MYRAEGSCSFTISRVAKLVELSTMTISSAGCVWRAMQRRHWLRLSARLRVMIHTDIEGIDIVGCIEGLSLKFRDAVRRTRPGPSPPSRAAHMATEASWPNDPRRTIMQLPANRQWRYSTKPHLASRRRV